MSHAIYFCNPSKLLRTLSAAEILEKAEEENQNALAEREILWQNQLMVYVQNGHEVHCYKKEKGQLLFISFYK